MPCLSWSIRFATIRASMRIAAVASLQAYPRNDAPSMPDWKESHRDQLRSSTSFVESAINEDIAKRAARKQQMRTGRHIVQTCRNVRFTFSASFRKMLFAIGAEAFAHPMSYSHRLRLKRLTTLRDLPSRPSSSATKKVVQPPLAYPGLCWVGHRG